MPVFGHTVIDDTIADEALDEGDIDVSAEFFVPAAEATDVFGG